MESRSRIFNRYNAEDDETGPQIYASKKQKTNEYLKHIVTKRRSETWSILE